MVGQIVVNIVIYLTPLKLIAQHYVKIEQILKIILTILLLYNSKKISGEKNRL